VTAKTPAKSTTVRERAGLTFKQSKHLDEVESAEAAMDMPGKRAAVDAKLVKMLGVDATTATRIRQEVEANLIDLPITLTVGGLGWFGKRAPRRKYGEAQYKAGAARRAKTSYAKLFGKKEAAGEIAHLGQYKGSHGQRTGARQGLSPLPQLEGQDDDDERPWAIGR
jgi:hypothetical protein